MLNVIKFHSRLEALSQVLKKAKRVLLTAPGAADGDSIGSQLALRRMIMHLHPECVVEVVNDEPLPPRYHFLSDVECVETPESYKNKKKPVQFDVGFVVDGGIDRAGRVKEWFDKCESRVFVDHHAVSAEYPYTIEIIEPTASSNTELIYHISQTSYFAMPLEKKFSEHIYLGLVFDTGFFRHTNTTPEAMELGAKLLRTGIDFTRLGERGMLERSFSSLQLMSQILASAKLAAGNKIIWSALTRDDLKHYDAVDDDREGIIDHLFLIHGIEVAILFFELADGSTKISLRSAGNLDVATFARGLTVCGGGHIKAAGANLQMALTDAIPFVLSKLEQALSALEKNGVGKKSCG